MDFTDQYHRSISQMEFTAGEPGRQRDLVKYRVSFPVNLSAPLPPEFPGPENCEICASVIKFATNPSRMKFERIHNKGQARLFRQPALEMLTKANPLVIWGMYLPVVVGFPVYYAFLKY